MHEITLPVAAPTMADQKSPQQEALEKLNEQLTCLVCLQLYTDPKLLQCNHVYCSACLVKLVSRTTQPGQQLSVSCPTCRQVTTLPANGVGTLRSAFHIHHLFDIQKDLMKGCVDVEADSVVAYSCSVHTGKKLELFCATCEELICLQCTVKSHHSHQYDLVSAVLEEHKKELTSSLLQVEEKLKIVDNAVSLVDANSVRISDQTAAIETYLHETFDKVHHLLDTRKSELIQQLYQISHSKIDNLVAQKNHLSSLQSTLRGSLKSRREELSTTNLKELLDLKAVVSAQMEEASRNIMSSTLTPCDEADIKFEETSTDITTLCETFGSVYSQSFPSPTNSKLIGEGLRRAEVGKKSSITLLPYTFSNEPCVKCIKEALECTLVSVITGINESTDIEKIGDGHYEITYTPSVKGKHCLCITINNRDVCGSPFDVRVSMSVENIRDPILVISDVETPCGIALDSEEDMLIVSESAKNSVSLFKANGMRTGSFGSPGSADGQFGNPCGVVVDSDGSVLVADVWNNRVQKFTLKGQFLGKVDEEIQFKNPAGIAINPKNKKFYISDCLNFRIVLLNPDLTYCGSFGRKGSGKGLFLNPWGLACADDGRVFVADCSNDRIQVFTSDGQFLRKFSKKGQGKGDLNKPSGICIGGDDFVYVTELGNHCVSVFTSEGHFVTSLGKEGSEAGEFSYPQSITIDSSGVLYVCDSRNDRVQLF